MRAPPKLTRTPPRYAIRTGRWGQYFHDTKHVTDMTLQAVLDRLHEIDPLKERLAKANKSRPDNKTF